jgi:hypothetical protein
MPRVNCTEQVDKVVRVDAAATVPNPLAPPRMSHPLTTLDACAKCATAPTPKMWSRTSTAGFTTLSVDGPVPWVYTIGLATLDHAELVIAGIDAHAAAGLLDALGRRVMTGRRLQPDTIVEVDGTTFGLAAVHPSRLASGLCAMWFRHEQAHPGSTQLEVIQVQVPDELFCTCHAGSQPRLDLPGGTPGPPRRERRRQRSQPRRAKRR